MSSSIISSLKFKVPSASVSSNQLNNYTQVKKIDVAKYTIDADTFVKSINVSDIYTTSGELDWDKVKKLIVPESKEGASNVLDPETNLYAEQYDLKTGDSFDEIIIRYSMLKSKITEKSNKSLIEYNTGKLDEIFAEAVDKNSTLLGIEFSDFFSGDITGKISLKTPKSTSLFNTKKFIENTKEMVLQRKNDFMEFVEENSSDWKDYMDYSAGKSDTLDVNFFSKLNNRDTMIGTKSEINMNFSELNKVSKLIVSISNNFNNDLFNSDNSSPAATELIAGLSIGLPLLKIDVAQKNFNLSSTSTVLLMTGVAGITKNLVEKLSSEKNSQVTDSNIYMYGGYLSEIVETSKSAGTFSTNYKKAIESIQSLLAENVPDYDPSKLFNKAGADWNKFLNLLDIPNKNSYMLTASEENEINLLS